MRNSIVAVIAAIAATTLPARAEFIYGITVPGAAPSSLVSFDSATPGTLTTVGPITGIVAGQTLRGIDFRPSNGQLYALSSSGSAAQLYTLNLATGAATAVGGGLTLTGNTSTRISLDFNPVVDALRVVTGTGQNYRVNANTGALINQDTNISGSPLISGIAYTNNVPGVTQTTLYGYDFLLDNLGTIGGLNGVPSPNTGTFSVIGNSGIVTGDAGLGFDISGLTGLGYISVDDFDGTPDVEPEFYRINLGTGALTHVGDFDRFVLDISVLPTTTAVPAPPAVVALLTGLFAAGGYARIRRRRPTAEAAA